MSLPKHERYKDAYKPGDVYWGLGIENETYIELLGKAETVAEFVRRNQKRERYSVDYWTIYKPGAVKHVLDAWIDGLSEKEKTVVKLPLLANGHTFEKCDRHGEHKTTYSKTPVPNPNYAGKSLYDELAEHNPSVFRDGKDVWWTFDGDTVEFMTQNYYCATMEDVIEEYANYKRIWIEALQKGLDSLGEDRDIGLRRRVGYPSQNYGLAVYLTNRTNVGIFNNGTYHINISLPTLLDKHAQIADKERFAMQHRSAARMFQWLSPFLVAKYGSGDVFSNLGGPNAQFPSGSQRLCASRFVSVGMYNTDAMEPGKIVLKDYARREGRWYELLYDRETCAYNRLPALGIDINYNKHWNHGLEFRIFDWFPEALLPELFRMLIWMCDASLECETVADPLTDPVWNRVMARSVWEGSSAILSSDECMQFGLVLGVRDLVQSKTILDCYEHIWTTWKRRWNSMPGPCSTRMIRTHLPVEEEIYETCTPYPSPSKPAPALSTPNHASSLPRPSVPQASVDPAPLPSLARSSSDSETDHEMQNDFRSSIDLILVEYTDSESAIDTQSEAYKDFTQDHPHPTALNPPPAVSMVGCCGLFARIRK